VLCSLWWLHHRLFLNFFKPDTVGVVMNFALLASVAMFTYPLQLFMRFGPEKPISFAAYAAGGALVYGIMAILLTKGIHQLGDSCGPQRRTDGVILATRLAILATSMVVALLISGRGPNAMAFSILSGVVVSAVVRRLQKRAVKAVVPAD
jgi:uncharacterized membrane protein